MLVVLLLSLSGWAQSYGILVNGKIYFQGTKVDEFEGFQQYLAHVKVASGDQLQLYDYDNKAAWAVDLNTFSVAETVWIYRAAKCRSRYIAVRLPPSVPM